MRLSREEAIAQYGSHYTLVNHPAHVRTDNLFFLEDLAAGKEDQLIFVETLGKTSHEFSHEHDDIFLPQTLETIAALESVAPDKQIIVISMPDEIELPYMITERTLHVGYAEASGRLDDLIVGTTPRFIPEYARPQKDASAAAYSFCPTYDYRGCENERGPNFFLINQSDTFAPTAIKAMATWESNMSKARIFEGFGDYLKHMLTQEQPAGRDNGPEPTQQ